MKHFILLSNKIFAKVKKQNLILESVAKKNSGSDILLIFFVKLKNLEEHIQIVVL